MDLRFHVKSCRHPVISYPFKEIPDCKRIFVLCLAANHMMRLVSFFPKPTYKIRSSMRLEKGGQGRFPELMRFPRRNNSSWYEYYDNLIYMMIEINGDTIAKGRTRYLTMPLPMISRGIFSDFPAIPLS